MGSSKSDKLYLIDFGSSFEYLNNDGTHKKNKNDKRYPGNIMFASMNICKGYRLSRRDDIESVVYILLYMLNEHKLPWSVY